MYAPSFGHDVTPASPTTGGGPVPIGRRIYSVDEAHLFDVSKLEQTAERRNRQTRWSRIRDTMMVGTHAAHLQCLIHCGFKVLLVERRVQPKSLLKKALVAAKSHAGSST